MRGMMQTPMPQLALQALEQGGVVTLQQTIDAGISRETRRRYLARGTLRELRRNFFTPGEYWDGCDERERHRIEIAGALMARRWLPAEPYRSSLVAGRRSAGFLHGLPLPSDSRDQRQAFAAAAEELPPWERRPWHVDLISADRGRRTFRAGVDVRPASLPSSHIILSGAVPISNVARTAVDLMREGTKAEGVMVADAALGMGVPRDELEAMTDHCRQWPNAVTAREAVAFGDGRAESPAESLARVVCAEADLFPELQVELYDAAGEIGRVDLLLRAFRIVLEVDGAIKYLDSWHGSAEDALRLEQERERRLWAAGWIVIRTTWHELLITPAAFIARIHAAMAQSPHLV